MNDSYLSIKDLVVEYSSGGEIVQAVNGVDIDLKKVRQLDSLERPVQAKPLLQRLS